MTANGVKTPFWVYCDDTKNPGIVFSPVSDKSLPIFIGAPATGVPNQGHRFHGPLGEYRCRHVIPPQHPLNPLHVPLVMANRVRPNGEPVTETD